MSPHRVRRAAGAARAASGARRAAGRRTPRWPRIAVFGGTFDPPHHGHLALAEWARVQLGLDRVIFVPAGTPPHKRDAGLSPAAHRLAMTRLAIRGNPAFTVSTVEARRPGPSWTSDTLRSLAAARPRTVWHLLMGADMFATFESWHEPDAIAAQALLVVAARPGSRRPLRARKGRRVLPLDNPLMTVSSSALRALAAAGLPLRYLVPDTVARYIERHGLYRGAKRLPR